jgi:CHAT domain-containing protein
MSKARSVSDMLGMGSIVPSFLMERISANSKASKLLDEETRLAQILNNKSPDLRLHDRIQLDDHRQKMRVFPELEELRALRDGNSETLATLDWLSPTLTERQVFLVDYLCLENGVIFAILDPAQKQEPEIYEIPVAMKVLKTWVDAWLNDCALKSRKPGPAGIHQLVQPLSQHTRRGDLIVLSPSGPLHSLPLQALLVDGQALIERNPVVYCPNLSILHQCFLRSKIAWDQRVPVLMGVYEEPEKEKQRRDIYDSCERYARAFGGKSVCGTELTKDRFQREIINAALVHFQGHLIADENNILEGALRLAPGTAGVSFDSGNDILSAPTLASESPFAEQKLDTTPESDNFDYDPLMESIIPSETLRVYDLFSMSLRAPVVTLIACGSGRQQVKAGDEPLGFVTAFLYAGATSVLGTLWSIGTIDGTRFTDRFYQHIQSQISTADRLIDLAMATQYAVCEIRSNPETFAPYHWAAFVLHGAWEVRPF